MPNNNFEKRLKNIASVREVELLVETDREKWFKLLRIISKDNYFYIWLKNYSGEYIPMDLEGGGLDREMYNEPFDEISKARGRGEEILNNIDSILKRKLVFHAAPGIFNKERGYILLTIDGKETKIMQKKNFFELSMA